MTTLLLNAKNVPFVTSHILCFRPITGKTWSCANSLGKSNRKQWMTKFPKHSAKRRRKSAENSKGIFYSTRGNPFCDVRESPLCFDAIFSEEHEHRRKKSKEQQVQLEEELQHWRQDLLEYRKQVHEKLPHSPLKIGGYL